MFDKITILLVYMVAIYVRKAAEPSDRRINGRDELTIICFYVVFLF